MAEAKKSSNAPNEEKRDPTIKQEGVVASYPEGSHPIRALKDQDWSAENKEYKDNPDKPDPTTVAQVEVLPDEK